MDFAVSGVSNRVYETLQEHFCPNRVYEQRRTRPLQAAGKSVFSLCENQAWRDNCGGSTILKRCLNNSHGILVIYQKKLDSFVDRFDWKLSISKPSNLMLGNIGMENWIGFLNLRTRLDSKDVMFSADDT